MESRKAILANIYLKEKYECVLNDYYADNGKKLHKFVDMIVNRKFGGTANNDMPEFYSEAGDVFVDIIQHDRYVEEKGNFEGFLYKALVLAFIDLDKRQNRDKRKTKIEIEVDGEKKKIPVHDVYLDAPIGDNENITIGDTIQSDFSMDNILSEEMGNIYGDRVEKYLSKLNKVQKQIIQMKMNGVTAQAIKKSLHLTDREYNQHCNELKSFANINILYDRENEEDFEEDNSMMDMVTQTMENCKTDKISIASIVKKIDRHTIRFDHPLQRESDQWSPSMKGNLISDILQGNKLLPLIFAEQIINGVPIIWDLDGKQRCTNAYSFSKNGYKISKNIRRWLIKYQTTKKDENGKDVLDENGFPIAVNDEFDIRGKRFADLPEELQDRFMDYNFNYDQYLNCSEEDIGYHIERYNSGKNMNTAQKGTVKLGTEYAEMVKAISAMPFFRDMGGYKVSEFKNGIINRVVVESIMAANFLDDWKKKQEDMCEYIKNNATSTEFDNFEDVVGRLEKVVTEDVADMFDSKDSFLWFGLFAKFIKTDSDDKKFIEFMTEFAQSLHSKEIDGVSFDQLNGKSTKDKNVVIGKMNHLEKLLYDYLNFNPVNDEDISILDFVKDNVDPDIIQADIEQYEEVLDDLTLNVDNSSKLLEEKNKPSLVAMVAYSFNNDIDLDKWIVDFFGRENTYIRDQKNNFSHMKSDLQKYIQKGKAA